MQGYQPRACFCKYDIRELVEIAKKKFIEGRSTVELMREASCDSQRDRIAIVAMLDLDNDAVVSALVDKTQSETCHVLSCRDMLRNQLRRMMLSV